MRSKFILLGTVAALSLISTSNSNAHQQGWYIGLEAGANWIGDNDFTIGSDFSYDSKEILSSSSYGPSGGSLDFDTGWAGFVTFGYGFDNNWRIELEGGYRSNDFDVAFGGPSVMPRDVAAAPWVSDEPIFAGKQPTGSLDEWTAMVNFIYDIPLAEKIDLSLGVGVGVDFSNLEVAGLEDSDTNFAYQAIVGLSYEITKRLDLTLNYRYLNVDAPSYSAEVFKDVYTANLEDIQKHTVTVGLRYDLYEDEAPVVVTPPPPPPPPAAEPEQFVVFFGFNKCNITAEADAVLTEAASAAKTHGSASVLIVGHTDTVGSNSYNQKLSECRANAAKSGLVSKGIGEGQITATGRGETELLVKTGDNVKEPQNRRATIDLKK
jgi:outer membrane protein OmpA-like peptidoglycan-associated protein